MKTKDTLHELLQSFSPVYSFPPASGKCDLPPLRKKIISPSWSLILPAITLHYPISSYFQWYLLQWLFTLQGLLYRVQSLEFHSSFPNSFLRWNSNQKSPIFCLSHTISNSTSTIVTKSTSLQLNLAPSNPIQLDLPTAPHMKDSNLSQQTHYLMFSCEKACQQNSLASLSEPGQWGCMSIQNTRQFFQTISMIGKYRIWVNLGKRSNPVVKCWQVTTSLITIFHTSEKAITILPALLHWVVMRTHKEKHLVCISME